MVPRRGSSKFGICIDACCTAPMPSTALRITTHVPLSPPAGSVSHTLSPLCPRSLILTQVQGLVGLVVAVMRGLLPMDYIDLALSDDIVEVNLEGRKGMRAVQGRWQKPPSDATGG
jgi:hypothetical protein